MQMQIRLRLDGAAFDAGEGQIDGEEIARILSKLADQLRPDDGLGDGDDGKLRDINGNACGVWSIVEGDAQPTLRDSRMAGGTHHA